MTVFTRQPEVNCDAAVSITNEEHSTEELFSDDAGGLDVGYSFL